MKKLVGLGAAFIVAVSTLVAVPAQASTVARADITNVVAQQKGKNYQTTALVKITTPRKGKTLKVSASFNPAGSSKTTGKTQKRTINAKWNKAGYYAASVKFTAKNVGKLSVSAKTSGKTVKKSHNFKLRALVSAAKATHVGVGKIQSAYSVRVIAPKQGSTLKISTSFNPAGSTKATGKTQKRTVKAKWNKAGYYAASVKFTAKAHGSLAVSAKPMKVTTTLKGARTSAVRGVISVSGAVNQTVSSAVTRTVTVSPAYGRSMQIQERINGTWKTIKTVKLAKAKKATARVSLPAPAAGSSRAFRVVLPASTGLGLSVGSTITLTRPAAPKPVTPPVIDEPTPGAGSGGQTGGGSGDNGSGGTPPPVPSGADCNAFDIFGIVEGPCSSPAYGLVLDELVAGDTMECGVARYCLRPHDKTYDGEFVMADLYTWATPNVNLTTEHQLLLAPKWLEYLNEYRGQTGLTPVKPMPTQSARYGYLSAGQGGIAQEWAEKVYEVRDAEGRMDGPEDHIDPIQLNQRWNAELGTTNATCGENLMSFGLQHSFSDVVNWWATSEGHNRLLISDKTHAAIGMTVNANGDGVAVLHMCNVPE